MYWANKPIEIDLNFVFYRVRIIQAEVSTLAFFYLREAGSTSILYPKSVK